ncbi:LOB domain-containing protein 1-like [Curcuma longa]|uniref:LOB domain-containing protein 1-like n=1 Tax=Curcuma longa TaxID=136217 RepID=UPI003D9F7C0B
MESSGVTTSFYHFSNSSNSSPTPSSPISSPPAPAAIHSPCSACKILRRRCTDKCVLAPYFPRTDPVKFTTAHRIFGASNIIKLLQDLPESQRADAVSSMVYEASARIRDPVYGCAGTIFHLQKQVSELQAQLARSQAELINLQAHNKNLLALICMDDIEQYSSAQAPDPNCMFQNDDASNNYFLEDISQSYQSYVFANSSGCEPCMVGHIENLYN